MKMKVEYFDNVIDIYDDYVNVIEIENKSYFYRFVSNLNEFVNNGFSDSVLFFEDGKEKNMNGKLKLFMDYFNFYFNSKKFEKDVNKYVYESMDEQNKNDLISQYDKIVKIFNKILNNMDLPLVIENDRNLENIIKLMKIMINCKDDLLENLLLLIDLEKNLGTKNIMFFVNLKQYLTTIELVELYKYSIYNHVSIILIDSQSYGCTNEYERKFIIDESLDEFML